MKYKILLSCFSFLLVFCSAECKTWHTAGHGYWDNVLTWQGGTAPSFSIQDTFIISHPVIFNDSLVLNSGAYIRIDTGGGLCGHHNIRVNKNAYILSKGLLELDTFNISGGKVECTAGNVIITYAGNISVSGSGLDVNGAGLTVGTWFNCKLPEYAEFAQSGIAESENYFNAISISPNPSSGTIKINSKYVYHNMLLKIINIHGQIVQSGYYATPDSENVDISSLRNGLYFWEIESANSISRGKLLISR